MNDTFNVSNVHNSKNTLDEEISNSVNNNLEIFVGNKCVSLSTSQNQFSNKNIHGITKDISNIDNFNSTLVLKEESPDSGEIDKNIIENNEKKFALNKQLPNFYKNTSIINCVDKSNNNMVLNNYELASRQIESYFIENPKESLDIDYKVSSLNNITLDIVGKNNIDKSKNNLVLEEQVQNPENYSQQTLSGNVSLSTRPNQFNEENSQKTHFSYFHLLPTIPLPITDIPHCPLCSNVIFVHEADLVAHKKLYHTKV